MQCVEFNSAKYLLEHVKHKQRCYQIDTRREKTMFIKSFLNVVEENTGLFVSQIPFCYVLHVLLCFPSPQL